VRVLCGKSRPVPGSVAGRPYTLFVAEPEFERLPSDPDRRHDLRRSPRLPSRNLTTRDPKGIDVTQKGVAPHSVTEEPTVHSQVEQPARPRTPRIQCSTGISSVGICVWLNEPVITVSCLSISRSRTRTEFPWHSVRMEWKWR